MKKLMTCAITTVLAAGLARPEAARAGQKEWATAGKILTGVVIAGVVGNARSSSSYARETTVITTAPHCESTTITSSSWAPHGPPPPPRAWAPRHEPQRRYTTIRRYEPACRSTPIIISQGYGQRLYQPPVRGHKAYVQVWSEVEGRWISVREHPSVW